jgi:signal transduction histidine kinase
MSCIAAELDVRPKRPVHGAVAPRAVKERRSPPDEAGLASALTRQAARTAATRLRPNSAQDAAVVAERHRIAREIHDTLAQGFAAIRLQLELALGEAGLPPQTVRALDLAYRIAGENLVEARRSLAALKSPQPSFEASLSAAIDGVRRLGQINVAAELTTVPAPPDEVAHELLRIAQEAMLNAACHAEAQTLRVSTIPVPGGLQLAIVDDGKGFDPTKAASGFGLVGLRERAAGIEAKLSIASAPGRGTQVVVTWRSPRSKDWTGHLTEGTAAGR